MEFLSRELFAGLTGQQVLLGAVAGVAVLLALRTLLGAGKKPETAHTVRGDCICGWSGNVSKFTRTCPKCNKQIHVSAR
jgi:hypothetical protein